MDALARQPRRLRTRLRSRDGFTMVELMAVVAIVAVLGAMVAGAMLSASQVMANATTGSNASVLEHSIDTALTDLLRYASPHVDESYGEAFDGPLFDSDSYLDVAGAPVRSGYLGVEGGRIALVTSAGSVAVPKAAGIYTDFTVREDDFVLQYNTKTKVFSVNYTLVGNGGRYERSCTFSCRTLANQRAA